MSAIVPGIGPPPGRNAEPSVPDPARGRGSVRTDRSCVCRAGSVMDGAGCARRGLPVFVRRYSLISRVSTKRPTTRSSRVSRRSPSPVRRWPWHMIGPSTGSLHMHGKSEEWWGGGVARVDSCSYRATLLPVQAQRVSNSRLPLSSTDNYHSATGNVLFTAHHGRNWRDPAGLIATSGVLTSHLRLHRTTNRCGDVLSFRMSTKLSVKAGATSRAG